eukprot:scaffold1299_cov385-Pavlova_lutheri.AAC.14
MHHSLGKICAPRMPPLVWACGECAPTSYHHRRRLATGEGGGRTRATSSNECWDDCGVHGQIRGKHIGLGSTGTRSSICGRMNHMHRGGHYIKDSVASGKVKILS